MKIGKLQLPRLSLMDWYITAELTLPFLLGVGLFSCVGVAVGTLSDLANSIFDFDLPIKAALQIVLFKSPEFIVYAFPVSLLLCTLMTYARLSKDSELLALQSAGISIYRLVIPALVFSLFVTVVTFFFNEIVVPASNHQATTIIDKYIQDERPFSLKKDIFFPEYENTTGYTRLKSLFYAKQFDGQGMKDLIILSWSDSKLKKIIVSSSAIWNPYQNLWSFFNGTVYEIGPDASYQDSIPFKSQALRYSQLPFQIASKSRDPYEMNIPQAIDYLEILRLSGDQKKFLMFRVRIQQKLSFPFVCVVFALIGAGIGVQRGHANKATSFGMSLGIIFVYYLLSFVIGALGLIGVLSPPLAAWLPNLCGVGVGGWLLGKAADE